MFLFALSYRTSAHRMAECSHSRNLPDAGADVERPSRDASSCYRHELSVLYNRDLWYPCHHNRDRTTDGADRFAMLGQPPVVQHNCQYVDKWLPARLS